MYTRKYINRILLLQILTHFFQKGLGDDQKQKMQCIKGCKMNLCRARKSLDVFISSLRPVDRGLTGGFTRLLKKNTAYIIYVIHQ